MAARRHPPILFTAAVQYQHRHDDKAGDDPATLHRGFQPDIGWRSYPCTEALPGSVIGRNAGNGFDFFSLNARLSRTFALTERVKIEGIGEAFNSLNHRNDMIPNGTWGSGVYPSAPNATFGHPTAVGDPRSIQLAARVIF